jgi:hypothetical protein
MTQAKLTPEEEAIADALVRADEAARRAGYEVAAAREAVAAADARLEAALRAYGKLREQVEARGEGWDEEGER